MLLLASDTLTALAIPILPMATANDTAFAMAVIAEESVAVIDTLPPASTAVAMASSSSVSATKALTSVATLFAITTPAPDAATAMAPAADAADPHRTLASISAASVADTVTDPSASRVASCT
ncbi:MAG: hypothetical protein BWX88_03617 [Planctomycetes bacterium ADurb.Bin126]|nr:MAG: hypothetical protein BWX88_03617 [Planctomycetes bacterium ADurb.Bin126]